MQKSDAGKIKYYVGYVIVAAVAESFLGICGI